MKKLLDAVQPLCDAALAVGSVMGGIKTLREGDTFLPALFFVVAVMLAVRAELAVVGRETK